MTHPYREFLRHHPSKDISKGNLVTTGPLEGLHDPARRSASTSGSPWPSPVLFWELWRFITPGLHKNEKRYVVPFVARRGASSSPPGSPPPSWSFPKALDWLIDVSGPGRRHPVLARPLLHPVRGHVPGLRGRVHVPAGGGVPRAGRGGSERHVAEVAAAGDRGDLPGRGGDHPEQRPVLLPRHGRADVAVLRGIDHHRPGACTSRRAGVRPGPASRPSSASSSTASSTRPSTPSTPAAAWWWRPRPGRARRWWPSTPWPGRWTPGAKAFYTTPLKALSNQKYGELVRRHGAERGRAADRRQLHQRRRPGGGDDDRGAAQHDLRLVAGARRAALRDPRRGPLPPERLPGPGLGGGHHPRPARGRPGLPVGDGVQRRGAGRLDPHRPGRDRRPSSRTAGRSSLHDLYLLGDKGSERLLLLPDPGRRPPQPRGRRPRLQDAAPPGHAGPAPGPAVHAPPGRGRSSCWRSTTCSRRSTSSSAGRRATTPSPSASGRASASPPPEERRQIRAIAEEHVDALSDDDLPVLDYAGLADRAGGRLRRPPRRDGAAVQGGGGSLLRGRPGQGGVRHRDPVARHQHAGPFGRDREAHQVHRGAPRVPHPGGVHPADRPGRPAGHRRGRLRRGAVVARSCPSTRWPGWPAPAPTPSPAASGPPTTWRPTWSAATRRTWPTTCSTCRSPSTGPTATWSAWRPSWSAPRRPSTEARRRGRVRAGRRRGVPAPAAGQRGVGPAAAVDDRRGDRRPRAGPAGRRADRAGRQVRRPGGGAVHRRAGAAATSGCGPSPRTAGWCRSGPATSRLRPRRWPRSGLPVPVRPAQRRLPAPGGVGPDRRPAARPRPGAARRAARRRWRGEVAMAQADGGRRPPGGRLPGRPAPPAGARAGRAAGPRRRPARAAGQGPHRVAGPPVRPGPAGARGVGIRRRVVPDRGRGAPGPALPRVRPAGRRVRWARACSTVSTPAELAGLVSVFTYEARGPAEPTTWFPTAPAAASAGRQIDRLAAELNAAEDEAGLPLTRRPDPGSSAWPTAGPAGEDLAEVIADEEISGGDFVRNVKQLIDLLRQLGDHGLAGRHGRGGRDAADAPVPGRGGRLLGPRRLSGARARGRSGSAGRPGRGHPPRGRRGPLRLGLRHGVLGQRALRGRRVDRRGGRDPPALLHQPRRARVRPGQPARGRQRRPVRPLLPHRKSLRRLFLDEFVGDLDISGDHGVDATVGLARAEQLYDRVFFEYGDDSVAQLGGVHLACEQASNLLTKVLERGRLMSYMEKSTRYVAYDSRLPNGRYRYYRRPGDPGLAARGPLRRRHGPALRRLRRAAAGDAGLVRRPATRRRPDDSDFVWRQSVRAKAFDALRGLLPAGATSNLGIYASGQAYEALLIRMRAHPLPEARDLRRPDADGAAQGDPVLGEAGRCRRPGRRPRPLPGATTTGRMQRPGQRPLRRRGPCRSPTAEPGRRPRGDPCSTGIPTPRSRWWRPCSTPTPTSPSTASRSGWRPCPRTSAWRRAHLRRRSHQSAAPAGPGPRAGRLPLRHPLRLRRLPGPATPPAADRGVAGPDPGPRLHHASRRRAEAGGPDVYAAAMARSAALHGALAERFGPTEAAYARGPGLPDPLRRCSSTPGRRCT